MATLSGNAGAKASQTDHMPPPALFTSAHHHHPHISFHSPPSLPHPAPNLSSRSPFSSSSLCSRSSFPVESPCSLRQFPQLSNLHSPYSFYNLSFTIYVSLHRSPQSFTALIMSADPAISMGSAAVASLHSTRAPKLERAEAPKLLFSAWAEKSLVFPLDVQPP